MFLPCLWILRLAGCCTLLEEARRPKQNRRRCCIVAKSERQVDGVRVDSDSEALPKSALHNLVSKRRFTDGQKVLGTQDEGSIQTCSRVQSGHRNFAGKWDSLHPTTCCVQRATCFVWSTRPEVRNSVEKQWTKWRWVSRRCECVGDCAASGCAGRALANSENRSADATTRRRVILLKRREN